jgi:phage/conjugal plasmid C-4 type zinc finger TraR family protein
MAAPTPAAAPADIVKTLHDRLIELGGNIARIETALRAPLDADFAEQAAELEGQDALHGIEDSHLAEAQAIHAALARIEAGSYGVCSNCGADIPVARLRAVPTATRCVNCAD